MPFMDASSPVRIVVRPVFQLLSALFLLHNRLASKSVVIINHLDTKTEGQVKKKKQSPKVTLKQNCFCQSLTSTEAPSI